MSKHVVDSFEAVPVGKALADQPTPNFTSIVCTNNQIVLLADSGLLYAIDWPKEGKMKAGTREIKPVPKLNNIAQISASFGHVMALRRVESPPFVEWTPEMVGEWMSKIGFSQSYKVCVYGKISGQVWLDEEDEDKFLSEKFSLDSESDVLKVKTERRRVKDTST